MKRFAFALFACLALASAGCARDAAGTAPTDNSSFKVERLFTVDGVSVYRFSDAGYYHYFADARGKVTTVVQQGKHGKQYYEISTAGQ